MKSLTRLTRFLARHRLAIALSILLLAGATAADLAVPKLTQIAIDEGILRNDLTAVAAASLAMLGMTLVSAALAIGNTLLAVRVSQSAAADLRRDLYAHIQSLSFGNLDQLQTGRLLIRLTSDVQQILQLVLLTMRMFVRAPLMIIGSLVFLFLIDWRLALVMLLLLPLTIVVFWLFATRAQPLYRRLQARLGDLNTNVQSSLAGMRVVKAFVRADHESARFERANVALMSQATEVGHLLALLLPVMRLVLNLSTLLVVLIGGLMAINDNLSIGRLVAFNNYLISVMFPLTQLGLMVGFLSAAGASAQRVFELLDTEPRIREDENAKPLQITHGRVVFENVSFSYEGDEGPMALQYINLSAKPTETVAILGTTGAGKSTLVHLIPRFYEATVGRVTIDGTDVRDVTLESLRSQVTIVLQEPALFSGTIRDNILYARTDASEKEMVKAARMAQIHGFVAALPDGYDTVVGQRGATLSGGQKQRLAIARALLTRPRVLILDDSTSSVDVETEAAIHAALLAERTARTTFIIAQRISTVLDADKIVVLDRGRIAAVGRHQDLLDVSPIYREMYYTQLGEVEKGPSYAR